MRARKCYWGGVQNEDYGDTEVLRKHFERHRKMLNSPPSDVMKRADSVEAEVMDVGRRKIFNGKLSFPVFRCHHVRQRAEVLREVLQKLMFNPPPNIHISF